MNVNLSRYERRLRWCAIFLSFWFTQANDSQKQIVENNSEVNHITRAYESEPCQRGQHELHCELSRKVLGHGVTCTHAKSFCYKAQSYLCNCKRVASITINVYLNRRMISLLPIFRLGQLHQKYASFDEGIRDKGALVSAFVPRDNFSLRGPASNHKLSKHSLEVLCQERHFNNSWSICKRSGVDTFKKTFED